MANNSNDIKAGLWKRQAKSGLTYYNGKVEIDGKEYYISIFNNKNKKSDRSPDLSMVIKPKDTDKAVKKPADVVPNDVDDDIDLSDIPF